jgi:flagellar biosynthetic protein FliP
MRSAVVAVVLAVTAVAAPAVAVAQEQAAGPMTGLLGGAIGGQPLSLSLQILVLMTLLTVLPSVLLMMTSFTRIIIVLSVLRQALGLAQTPPNQVLVGLSVFLTFFVMAPTFAELNTAAIDPYSKGTVTLEEGIARGGKVMHRFMLAQTRERDLKMFADMANRQAFASAAEVPFSVLVPAFVTSELKTAFQIGFLIFLPFVIIDLVVASVLMALGMMMLSPTLISLPFKLLLFVAIDGWALTMSSLATSFSIPGA